MAARRNIMVVLVAGLVTTGSGCGPSNGDNVTTQPMMSSSATGYDYAGPTSQPVPMSARAAIQESTSQWPADGKSRMEAMTSRLDRVSKRISVVVGVHCIPRIGATDRGVVANEDGTLEVDATTLWKLDEDGLAALVARELAHQVLGHRTDMERIRKDSQSGLSGTAQRERGLEITADEFAGRVIAKAHYRPEAFVTAVRRVPDSGSVSASVSQTYSVEQRWAAFQRGYSEAVVTTQPASQAAR